MKALAAVAILAVACVAVGCHKPAPQPLTVSVSDYSAEAVEKEWHREYVDLGRKYMDSGHICIDEMRSLAYRPVDSGPACHTFCRQLDEMNALVDKSPVFDREKYRLTKSDVCKGKRKHQHSGGQQ